MANIISALGDQAVAAPVVDDIDRTLIRLLQDNVRVSNRELGDIIGISQRAVASRIKRLRSDNLLATTVVVDWAQAGYAYSAFALIRVDGAVGEVIDALAIMPNLQSVTRTFGEIQIVVVILAESLQQLRETVDRINAIPGVSQAVINTAVDYYAYRANRALLPTTRWSAKELPLAKSLLDALDMRLIDALIDDGHQSNRQIAARLEVSEATIRLRLQQLEASKLIRLVAMADPFALHEAYAVYACIRTRDVSLAAVANRLTQAEACAGLVGCVGEADLVAVLVSSSLQELLDVTDGWRELAGIKGIEVYPISGVAVYRAHLAVLGPSI